MISLRKLLQSFRFYSSTILRFLKDEEFLTIDEAAKLLTLSKQTIYGLVSKSTIPHLKKVRDYTS
ncbi:MAG: helix-turn-helix domain-containing protein [Saprospiraceae bacterium]|nr:helix-turn-helix domain-containing protein [Candidatus Brachybacter algidus]